MKKVFWAIFLIIPFALFSACGGDTESDDDNIRVRLLETIAGGSAIESTTEIELIFDRVIEGFNADDITVTGAGAMAGVQKGGLFGDGPDYTLLVEDIIVTGTITIRFSKPGYRFSPSSVDVTVFFSNDDADDVEFEGVMSNGAHDVTTTTLTFNFADIGTGSAVEDGLDLTAANIYLSGEVNATKGDLTETDPGVFTLDVTVTKGGTLVVEVVHPDFNFVPPLRETLAFRAGEFKTFDSDNFSHWPFLSGQAFMYPNPDSGRDQNGRIWEYWAQHAANTASGAIWYGMYFPAPGGIVNYVGYEGRVYNQRMTYELMITTSELADSFNNFNVLIYHAGTQSEPNCANFDTVKSWLVANPGRYITVEYDLSFNTPADLTFGSSLGLGFIYGQRQYPDTDPDGRVYLRNIRFYE